MLFNFTILICSKTTFQVQETAHKKYNYFHKRFHLDINFAQLI